jgi:hypothetical protein
VLLIGWFLIVGFVKTVVGDLVVPVMYRRRCRATEAWSEVWALVKANQGTMALYYLFRLLLNMAVGMMSGIVVLIVGLITCLVFCCLVSIPLLGAFLMSVLLLPLSVFLRSYSVYFLGQFHPDYVMLPADPDDYGGPEGEPEARLAR